MRRVSSGFLSRGVTCAGDLYLPDGAGRPPVIVMAHGFGAVRKAGLPRYAERFASAGYAVHLFDYRTFGDSAGEPRQWVSPGRQLDDWRAAIAHVRSLEAVDARRVVLWGVSFSGGHVLSLAAREPGFAAVLALVPHVSALASLMRTPVANALRLFLSALLDTAGRPFGRPRYSRTFGRPGELAALTGPECWDGYRRLIGAGAQMENRVLSRIFLEIPFYSPLRRVGSVRAPTQIIAGARDGVTPQSAAKRAADRIGGCEFQMFDGNHFDPFFEEAFEQVASLQLDFLRRTVPA